MGRFQMGAVTIIVCCTFAVLGSTNDPGHLHDGTAHTGPDRAASDPMAAPQDRHSGDRTSADDFVALFDGSTLHGWVVENSDGANFIVRDGVLRVDGPEGWLRSEEVYTDFDLRVEFRFLTDDADSGVFVRVGGTESTFVRGWPAGSYQIQTRDVTSNRTERPRLLGDVYRHGMPEGVTEFDAETMFAASRPTGEWQVFDIEVVGDSLSVALNGTPVTRASGIANASGFLGIQGETDTVEFRAIDIREK